MPWQLVGNIAGKDADASIVTALQAEVVTLKAQVERLSQYPDEATIKAWTAEMVASAMSAEREVIPQTIKRFVEEIPKPQDGRSLTAEDVAPLIAGEVRKAVEAIPPAKDGADGVSVVNAVITRENTLLLTLSDGSTKDCGVVVGRDGADADMDAIKRHVDAQLEKWPRPKDGKDGRDGLGIEHSELVLDEQRGWVLRWGNGDVVKEQALPFLHYKGVYKAGTTYVAGSSVTWGGSLWVASKDTSAKPGDVSPEARAWILAAKRGSDGKPGPKGDPGPRGPQGPEGPRGPQGY